MDTECYICGKHGEEVFFEFISKNPPNYIVQPICINCKSTQLKNSLINNQLVEIKKWEDELSRIENTVASSIINTTFSDIKFKEHAKSKLIDLMKKYSVRNVFEVCTTYEFNQFNIHDIESKIKDMIK